MNLEEDQDAIVGVLSGMTTSAYSVGWANSCIHMDVAVAI